MTDEYKAYIWSSIFHGGYLGGRDLQEICDVYKVSDYTAVTDPSALKDYSYGNISDRLRSKLLLTIKKYDEIVEQAEKIKENCLRENVFLLTATDKDYPDYWKNLRGMPQLVFCKGRREILSDLNKGSVAIVGSRDPSDYSMTATRELTEAFTEKGITVVSGMAQGIDRCAHITTLNNKGKTIAFLAGGVDNIYPWTNKDIYMRLAVSGLIISEMPPGTKAQRQYFPSRNRLISAISDACLVMEAGIHSGTLHTASFAAAQGKSVYVLPNTIYSESAMGGLRLISDGANILLNADDVINDIAECSFYRMIGSSLIPDTEDNEVIFQRDDLTDDEWKKVIKKELSIKPLTSDMLSSHINLPFYRLSALLSQLEVEGTVEQRMGKFVLTIGRQ